MIGDYQRIHFRAVEDEQWDDLEKGVVGGQVCGVRERWRIFCMKWGIEEKLNWEKIFGMKKESPSNASNIFRVIETRLDFWCLSGSFITADGPNHKRQTFKNGVKKAVCLKITNGNSSWERLRCYVFCKSLELSGFGCRISMEN